MGFDFKQYQEYEKAKAKFKLQKLINQEKNKEQSKAIVPKTQVSTKTSFN